MQAKLKCARGENIWHILQKQNGTKQFEAIVVHKLHLITCNDTYITFIYASNGNRTVNKYYVYICVSVAM